MRQARVNTGKQIGVLPILCDLLGAGGVQSRVIQHIKLNMEGPVMKIAGQSRTFLFRSKARQPSGSSRCRTAHTFTSR
ncbi:hypothetical protein HD596_001179 [Nonomuraea jabiensis]|uniref:Uncharacterized protein n=1 Tax=Nonomuraea jabiensis TaxID=882448 RepID=A0A7W9FZJ0_9ACTN|nr:hypothetical protein [Nonomuraea jabiensis]